MSPDGSALRPPSAFDLWAVSLDTSWRRASYWPQGWIAAAALLAGVLVAAARVPQARAFFGLRLAPALALQGLALAVALGFFAFDTRHPLSPRVRGLAVCGIGFFYQLHASSLVALSRPPGSFALATLAVLAAWLHLAMTRTILRRPFLPLAHGAGMLAAFALGPTTATAEVLAVVALLGLGGGLSIGAYLARIDRHLAGLAAQREAMGAQAQAAVVAEREHAEAALASALDREREARAGLTDALQAADRLEREAERAGGAALREAAVRLRADVARLARTVWPPEPLRALGSPASTEVWPTVRAVLADAAARAPGVRIVAGPAGPALERACARVAGGADGLRQIVDNLVANACEGDGSCSAGRVDVALLEEDAGGSIALRVADDGPGFPAAQLAGALAPFGSSKAAGTGLGLYIAAQLARASGGSLRRRNLEAGGAEVIVVLPRDEAASEGGGRGRTGTP